MIKKVLKIKKKDIQKIKNIWYCEMKNLDFIITN